MDDSTRDQVGQAVRASPACAMPQPVNLLDLAEQPPHTVTEAARAAFGVVTDWYRTTKDAATCS